jgi:hypothetical protein
MTMDGLARGMIRLFRDFARTMIDSNTFPMPNRVATVTVSGVTRIPWSTIKPFVGKTIGLCVTGDDVRILRSLTPSATRGYRMRETDPYLHPFTIVDDGQDWIAIDVENADSVIEIYASSDQVQPLTYGG